MFCIFALITSRPVRHGEKCVLKYEKFLGTKLPCTLGWPYTEGTLFYCDCSIWYLVLWSFNLFCIAWLWVCVDVLVMCVLAFTVFCIVCTFFYFLYCFIYVYLLQLFVCIGVRTTATEWSINCSKLLLLLLLLLYFHLVPKLRLSGATGWKIRGSNPNMIKKYFSCANRPYLFWGPQSLLFNAYRDSFIEMRSRAEADRLPLCRAKVKNEWTYAPSPTLCLHGAVRDCALFTLHV
jgi:hypothetical protein